MEANRYIGQFLETLDSMDISGKRIPGLIMSSPGYGKTTTIEKWADIHGYNRTTLIASNFNSDDILGIEVRIGEEMKRLPPSWYNEMVKKSENGKRNILFLDEISAADPYVQAPLFNLIFNHSLAGRSLPENTLIIAAGNYSEELGNSFKMTAPLVNRFLILNLMKDDYSFSDIIFGTGIDSIKDDDSMRNYLGIEDMSLKKRWSFERFRDWVAKERSEFRPGKSEFHDDLEMGGLLGFISLRSFSYCLQFSEEYMSRFNDDIWMRIVGDTLGVSQKREGKPMREVIFMNRSYFLDTGKVSSKYKGKSMAEICQEMLDLPSLDTEDAQEGLTSLEEKISKASLNDFSSRDFKVFTSLCSKYPSDERIKKLLNIVETLPMERSN